MDERVKAVRDLLAADQLPALGAAVKGDVAESSAPNADALRRLRGEGAAPREQKLERHEWTRPGLPVEKFVPIFSGRRRESFQVVEPGPHGRPGSRGWGDLLERWVVKAFSQVLAGMKRAARRCGAALRQAEGASRGASLKAARDLVTRQDLENQRWLQAELAEVAPGAGFWGEEGAGADGGGQEWLFVVDPLDGTTNFVHGYPHCAISLALLGPQGAELAVVHDPFRRELFWARRGRGAWLEGRPIRVSAIETASEGLWATGLAGPQEPRYAAQFEVLAELEGASHGVRRDSCASLNLAYVAAGRLEGFWEIDLQPWDVAAGLLLVAEAGGRATGLAGEELRWRLPGQDYAVSNGHLHASLLERVRPLVR